jgi:hypothetical protein
VGKQRSSRGGNEVRLKVGDQREWVRQEERFESELEVWSRRSVGRREEVWEVLRQGYRR